MYLFLYLFLYTFIKSSYGVNIDIYWDAKETHSTSHSNGSPVSSQLYGKELQHIFDYKVGKLRALLTADEDIKAELDQVVNRLMKLAMKTCRDRDTPPTSTWLQCKLLDLLTLTERAIERRKRHYFDKNQLTIQSTDLQENQKVDQLEISNADDNTVKEIIDKYCHFIQPSENTDDFNGLIESCVHIEVEDNISVTSMVKIFDNNAEPKSSPTKIDRNKHFKGRTRDRKSPIGAQWKHDNYSGVSSSGDTDHSFKTNLRSSSRRADKRCKHGIDNVYHRVNVRTKRRRLSYRHYKINENWGVRNDRKRLLKRFIVKKNLRWYLLKNTVKYEHYQIGIKKTVRQHRPLKTFIKPVSTINLRQRGANKDLLCTLKHDLIKSNNEMNLHNQESIAVTEESCTLEIITDGMNETIALRRTIATDAYDNTFEIGEQLSPSSKDIVAEENTLMPEDIESKPIFLYDINEPSTSKGIRHVNMDVQCGDVLSPFLSPVTSLHRTPGIIANSVNDGYSENTKPHEEYLECNVLRNSENPVDDTILKIKTKSNGIQIKDSAVVLHKNENTPTENNLNQDFKVEFGSKLKNIDVLERVKVCNVMESKKFCSEMVRSSAWHAENERDIFSKSIYEKNNVIADLMSDVNNENNFKNDVAFPKTDIKRELICGGIFVHSYKDRTACEDILYQGKWQRSALRLVKTNPRQVRNYSDLPVTKVKNCNKEVFAQKVLEKTRYKSKKCISYRQKLEIEKSKGQEMISNSKESPVVSSTPKKCSDKKMTMASTKIPVSLVMCKNTKNENNTLKEVNKSMVNVIKENKSTANLKKKNTPKYLQRRKYMYISKNFEETKDPISDAQKIGITNDDLVISSRTNIKKELLKYICDPSHDITYSVFRNQIENKKGSDVEGLVVNEINNSAEDKTTSNLQSANSSCSSNNSIATVKQLSPHNKDLQTKGKFISTKSFLRLKNAKKSSPISNTIHNNENCKQSSFMFENKENFIESSISNVKTVKEKTQDPIKSILIAQNNVSNHRSNLSNIKNNKNSKDIGTNSCISRVSLCKTVLLPEALQNAENYKQICIKVDPQNQIHIAESNKTELLIESLSIPQSMQAKNQKTSSKNKKSAVESTDVEKIGKNYVELYDEVKTMLEERLNFIENLPLTKRTATDNRKITPEDCNEFCDNSSLDKSVAEDSVHSAKDSLSSWRSGPEPVSVDLISFKSFASISGISEYYCAENRKNSTLDSLQILTPPVRSVHDIFERNDQLRVTNSIGLMGTPDFNRFSINERIMGDQPDYVNLIDSETGSLAHCVEVRRTTSEEVFTSGQSSDTYVSCQVDDENVVPHWLFRMNDRQDSDEEQSTPALSPVPLPAVAPQLDVNGNVPEQGVGVSAGAGDGRGIHSDQDSSGRDTSLSSTETSSGQQSEALLVDPPGFDSNMEFLREPSSRPFVQIPSTAIPNASFRTAEGSENDNVYNMSEGCNRNALNHETITSDRDADVSSLDTDIADFSDN